MTGQGRGAFFIRWAHRIQLHRGRPQGEGLRWCRARSRRGAATYIALVTSGTEQSPSEENISGLSSPALRLVWPSQTFSSNAAFDRAGDPAGRAVVARLEAGPDITGGRAGGPCGKSSAPLIYPGTSSGAPLSTTQHRSMCLGRWPSTTLSRPVPPPARTGPPTFYSHVRVPFTCPPHRRPCFSSPAPAIERASR